MSSLSGRTGANIGLAGPSGRIGNKIPGGYKLGQIAQFDPQQQELYKRSFAQVGPESYLSRLAGGEQGMFDEMEAPALRQFSGLQGNLASRFSGMGGLGARRSSGFQNTSTQAAADFAQQLQANRQNLQRQAIGDLQSMTGSLLGYRPYEQRLIQKQNRPSGFQSFLRGAAPLVGAGIGALGGPMGMALGAQLGGAVGNSLGGGQQQPMDFSGIGSLPTSFSGGGSLGGNGMGTNYQLMNMAQGLRG